MPVNYFRDARGGVSSWQQAQPKQRAVVSKDVRRLSDICEMRINIITQVRIVFNTTSGTMRMADGPRPRVFSRGGFIGECKTCRRGWCVVGGDERRYAGAWTV